MVAILGPTASGKSALALALAAPAAGGDPVLRFDAGLPRAWTSAPAKPSAAERAAVPHHLLDLVDPGEPFHAARWAELAARGDRRGHRPRAACRSSSAAPGLYFRALVRGLFEAPPSDPELRARHEQEARALGVPALHARLAAVDPEAAARILPNDLLRISRALEIYEQTGVPMTVLHRQAPAAGAAGAVHRAAGSAAASPAAGHRGPGRRHDGGRASWTRCGALRAAGYGAARALAGLGYRQLGEHLDGAIGLAEAVARDQAGHGRLRAPPADLVSQGARGTCASTAPEVAGRGRARRRRRADPSPKPRRLR